MRNFAHQREVVVLRVAEESHPQIIRTHIRDKYRLFPKMNTAVGESLRGLLNVVHFEVENRAGMIKFRLLRKREHEPETIAIEESHPGWY